MSYNEIPDIPDEYLSKRLFPEDDISQTPKENSATSHDTLGGSPYTVETIGEVKTLRFYPKNGKFPNDSVLVLNLDKDERLKLINILSQK